MTTSEDLENEENYPTVVDGKHCAVRMTKAIKAEFDKLSIEVREFILATMTTYASQRQPRPAVAMGRFNADEGRWPAGHHQKEIQIGAFKHTKAGARIYGSCFHFLGRATFLCSEIDTNKKSRKADTDILKSAAKKIGDITHGQTQTSGQGKSDSRVGRKRVR